MRAGSAAKGTRLTITATDLELSVRTSCDAKIKKEGAGTIPAKKLLELVRLLPGGEIKFRLLEVPRAGCQPPYELKQKALAAR